MEQEIYNKEYTIGKILSESWKKFTQNFQLILLVTLAVYIPINIILFFVSPDVSLGQGGIHEATIYLGILLIFYTLIGIIATMAIAYIVKQKIDGKTVNFSEAIKKSLSRWPAAIGTNIILGIFLFGLSLLLVVPGIIYHVYWLFVTYVVILHDKSGKSALDHSKNIVRGRWWKVAGYSLVFISLSLVAAVIIGSMEGIILGIILALLPENFVVPILALLLGSITDFLLAYFTIVSIIFFINFDSTKKEVVASQITNS